MDSAALRFAAPASPEAVRLNQLLAEHDRVVGELRDAERSRDFASTEQEQASEALAELERQRARGESVTDAARTKAERALADARARAAAPWSERIRGMRAAQRDSAAAISHYIGQHFAELAEEVEVAAVDAAERVDRALAEIAAAYAERERVSAHSTALLGQVEAPRPNAVPLSRVENVVKAAQAVLLEGGEVAPAPRRREVSQAVEA